MNKQKNTDALLPSIYQSFSNNFKLNSSMASTSAPLIVNSAGCQPADKYYCTNMPHGRADFYLIYVIEGRIKLRWQDKDFFELKPGNFVFIPPHCPYEYFPLPPYRTKYLWTHFTGSYAGDYLRQYLFSTLPCKYSFDLNLDIVMRFQNLLSSFDPSKTFLDAELAARLDSILRALARIVLQTEKPDNIKINRSVNYINTQYHTDLRIAELAKMEYLSVSRYITVFRKSMGMPPSQYIIRTRLNAACILLQESTHSIKEIGSMVGYNEPHYFYSLFKKHTGLSPGEYRSITGSKG